MNSIKLTAIGTGDAFGSGGRLQTCFRVDAPGSHFLIDCGASSITGLKRGKVNPNDIDTILITHFHGDHFGGLPFFLLEAAVYEREKPLTIISPPGCKEKVAGLLKLLYPGSEVLEKLDICFKEYQPLEIIDTGCLTVQAFPVIHSDPALPHGLRICIGDKVISYSGDTEWTENLIPLSAGADLFICECNFFKFQAKGHLNYHVLKSRLSDLLCQRIVLTHFGSEMLDNLNRIDLECLCDGSEIEF